MLKKEHVLFQVSFNRDQRKTAIVKMKSASFVPPYLLVITLLTMLCFNGASSHGAWTGRTTPHFHSRLTLSDGDDNGSIAREIIYSKTTNSDANRAMKNISTPVKRDVIKAQESPLSSSASLSASTLRIIDPDSDSAASLPALESGESGASSSSGALHFNGAICRHGSNPADLMATVCTNGTKVGDNHTATPYYTIVNLDNHNDVVCDEEYETEEYNENCFIDHNVTCVGDPLFCNLTYEEYQQLLMDYIYPSTGEWILIASHTVVFIMGLVSKLVV